MTAPASASPDVGAGDDTPARTPSVAFTGHLRLVAQRRDDGRTVLAEQEFRAPFHLGKPYWDGAALQVQIVNPTAGILSGDRLQSEIRVGPGAVLSVTTPAASRAFMMRHGVAECRQHFHVSAGGWLEYFPEPLCPHRDTDYAQHTTLSLEAGAAAFWCDSLAPGRIGRGEKWAWRRLVLALAADFAGEPVLRERLDASGEELRRLAEFHGTPDAWFANALLFTDTLTPADPVWDKLRALHRDGVWCGVTRLRRGGWVIRAITPSGQSLRDTLAEIRRLLAGPVPPLRTDWRKL